MIYIAALEKRPSLDKAWQAHSKSAAELRANQPFYLSYNGGGTEQVIGWEVLAKQIQLKENTVRVLLSKGNGSFSIKRTNPLTGEPDILSVTRILLPGQPKSKRGRPRTRPITEAEYLRKQGITT